MGKTWNENRSFCRADGGDLVSIETEHELDLIVNDIKDTNKQRWHIGLVRENGSWTWVSGRPLTIFKWGDQPSGGRNRATLVMKNQKGHFSNQFHCGEDTSYICEMPKGKNTLHLYTTLQKEPRIGKVSPRHRVHSYVQV